MKDLDQVKLLEKLRLMKRNLTFLYIDGDNCHFMDNKTFDQVEIPKLTTGEQYKLLKENLEVTISFMEGNLFQLSFQSILSVLLKLQMLQLKIRQLHLHTSLQCLIVE